MKPFNRERFLFWMLAGIFVWQASIFSFAVIGCFRNGLSDACPDLGKRYENTVNVMVATTLALLGAGAVTSASQRKPSVSDPDASASPPPLQLQQPSPESSSPSEAQKKRSDSSSSRGPASRKG